VNVATVVQISLTEGCPLDLERLGGTRAPVRAALSALASGGASDDDLAALAGDEAPYLFYCLTLLARRLFLRWTVVSDGAPLLTLKPLSPDFGSPGFPLDERRRYQLSSFTYSRWEAGELLVSCPLSHASITGHDRRAALLLFELSRPVTVDELADRVPELEAAAARAAAALLLAAGMIAAVPAAKEGASPIEQWEFHDLLFHTRSRLGRHLGPSGATYRFGREIPEPPVVKPPMSDATLDLFRPDIKALRREDVPFTEVLERRRTVYELGASPITGAELGELLFRSARLAEVRKSPEGELSLRPYPSGGARHALELYPVVQACAGVPAGLYHYGAGEHRLERLSGETNETRALLSRASVSAGEPGDLQVLIVIAARFQRATWKYEGIAYALLLKEVGALLQTMYLVATAMKLAPCALGLGDSDLFARAAGTEYYAETSIGEFLIGSRADR
jgi:SagB-type dehydrogenase family enzyme